MKDAINKIEATAQKAWYEKYRPVHLGDIILPDEDVKRTLDAFYENGFVRGNILSYGAAGFGKSSVNEVLINRIVKERKDIFILERKTENVDELKEWLQYLVGKSTQKVVKIEEIDKLSPQAQTILKDGLMEKYQSSCTFLATTNKPEKLDPAILSRFNIKINFKDLPVAGVFERLKFILEQEGVSFSEEELLQYTKTHRNLGFREMINTLELVSSNGEFKAEGIKTPTGTKMDSVSLFDHTQAVLQELQAKFDHHLDKAEMAKVLGFSSKTLGRRIKKREGIPNYIDVGGGKVIFPLSYIAEFYTSGIVETKYNPHDVMKTILNTKERHV